MAKPKRRRRRRNPGIEAFAEKHPFVSLFIVWSVVGGTVAIFQALTHTTPVMPPDVLPPAPSSGNGTLPSTPTTGAAVAALQSVGMYP
jgi:hypothetical protein